MLFLTPVLSLSRSIYCADEKIEREFPDEAEARKLDKLRYRYPGAGGESYIDVIERLRPLIVELERTRNDVLIVCHTVRFVFSLSLYMARISVSLPPFIS